MMTRLITERLMMRRMQPSDLEDLHALVSQYDVVKDTASWPYPADRDFTKSRAQPSDPANGMSGPVFHKGQMVGVMSLLDGELGYMFAPDVWGQGFATEMGRALIDHIWTHYDLDEITALAFEGNHASFRVLEKLGFKKVGSGQLFCRSMNSERTGPDFVLPRP